MWPWEEKGRLGYQEEEDKAKKKNLLSNFSMKMSTISRDNYNLYSSAFSSCLPPGPRTLPSILPQSHPPPLPASFTSAPYLRPCLRPLPPPLLSLFTVTASINHCLLPSSTLPHLALLPPTPCGIAEKAGDSATPPAINNGTQGATGEGQRNP